MGTTFIKKGTHLGVSHIYAPGFHQGYIRTPIGGFINHDDESNCVKIESPEESMLTYYSLVTTKDIEKDGSKKAAKEEAASSEHIGDAGSLNGEKS